MCEGEREGVRDAGAGLIKMDGRKKNERIKVE